MGTPLLFEPGDLRLNRFDDQLVLFFVSFLSTLLKSSKLIVDLFVLSENLLRHVKSSSARQP